MAKYVRRLAYSCPCTLKMTNKRRFRSSFVSSHLRNPFSTLLTIQKKYLHFSLSLIGTKVSSWPLLSHLTRWLMCQLRPQKVILSRLMRVILAQHVSRGEGINDKGTKWIFTSTNPKCFLPLFRSQPYTPLPRKFRGNFFLRLWVVRTCA